MRLLPGRRNRWVDFCFGIIQKRELLCSGGLVNSCTHFVVYILYAFRYIDATKWMVDWQHKLLIISPYLSSSLHHAVFNRWSIHCSMIFFLPLPLLSPEIHPLKKRAKIKTIECLIPYNFSITLSFEQFFCSVQLLANKHISIISLATISHYLNKSF